MALRLAGRDRDLAADLAADKNLLHDLVMLDETWNPPPNPYANDPLGWVKNIAQVETWSKQREIYQSVADNRYTTVRSCHGPGKSFTAAQLICWWLDTQYDPFVVTSAPTSHQVRTILWREITRAKRTTKLAGKITRGQVPEWRDGLGELIAFGRKPADYLDPQEAAAAFQGIHATSLLVVLDEGSGIPDWLADACENLITNEYSRMLIIGNPDNPQSYFERTHREGSGWNKIKISAFDCPWNTGEKISTELAAKLTSKLWVEERAARWGKHSPLYKSKVLAEFPEVTDDTVFTPAMISLCVATDRSKYALGAKQRLGMDIARLGVDETVVYSNRNGYCRRLAQWHKADTMESVGNFRRLRDITKKTDTVIDINGVGAGVFDRLNELGYSVIPFNGGEKAYDFTRFRNRRAETHWAAREAMEEGQIDLEDLDEDLLAELYEVKYKINSNGQTQIEAKEDLAQRLGHSPDRADAFIQSLIEQAAPSFSGTRQTQTQTQTSESETQADFRQPEPEPANTREASDLVGDLMNMDF
jgi:hypothetical protein